MKRVVSISLGSSHRDSSVTEEFCGQRFSIERIGTDGDRGRATALIRELDGKVDAFGLGGTDLYIYAGRKRYTIRESASIAASAVISPIVDGSGIKNTLERRVIECLEQDYGMCFRGLKTLVVCAVDRFGLADALVGVGADVVFGDLLFGVGIPVPIRTTKALERLATVVAPIITLLPTRLFYPTGKKQKESNPRFSRYFLEADVIAGDFHFIRRYMPYEMPGKTIITNTVTKEDERMLAERGVATLVTTTPEMGGRSFGTNILEGVLVALAGRRPEELSPEDYVRLLDEIGVRPRYKRLDV